MTDFSVLAAMDNKRVHNFSLGVLNSYFNLNAEICRNRTELIGREVLVLCGIRNPKVFVFEQGDVEYLKELQKTCTIYSIDRLSLQGESKFVEIAYDLKTVFNSASYPNAKKRYQRISYPFVWMRKNCVVVKDINSCPWEDIENLHSAWVGYKMEQEGTYRMMFPSARYLRCCQHAATGRSEGLFDIQPPVRVGYRSWCFFLAGELVAVRVVSVQNDVAYDLAFFGNTWSTSSNMMNYFDTFVLGDLFGTGITFFNCGAEFSKGLRDFKQHLPSMEVVSWMYSKQKGVKL